MRQGNNSLDRRRHFTTWKEEKMKTIEMNKAISNSVMAEALAGINCNEVWSNEKVCADCGCIIEDGEGYELPNGDMICDDCFCDSYGMCEDCGNIVPIGEMIETGGGYCVCEDCLENNYFHCDYCGEYHHNDERFYVRGVGDVCEHCIDWGDFYYCEDCGEYVHADDWDFDYDCCYECAEERAESELVKPYHWHKDMDLTFFGDASNSILRNAFIGVEWELDYDGYAEELAEEIEEYLSGHVFYEQDCSITGMETIFMPHTYEEYRYNSAIRQAFERAEDMGAYCSNAGLHVHISREAFGKTEAEQNENIAKVCILHNEGDSYNKMVKLARRTDRNADCWARAFSWDKTTIEDNAKDYVNRRCGSHGIAINCENSATVEFRLGAGTVDYDEFMAWLDIIVMIVNKSKTISFKDAGNFDVWFEDANNNIKSYMEAMNIRWCAPKRLTDEDYKAIIEKLMDSINASCTATGCSALDYNTMLYAIAHVDEQTRRALGYL